MPPPADASIFDTLARIAERARKEAEKVLPNKDEWAAENYSEPLVIVENFAIGARVCALVAGGGYAEYCTVPAVQCLPVPAGLNEVQAAALPETFFTVWTNVFQRGRLAAGEHILVQPLRTGDV